MRKVKESKDDLSVKKKRAIHKRRLKLINSFIKTKSKPNWMIIRYLPVLPPNIRPIVRLQDKTLITTDLNFLYAKIININTKITKLRLMRIPEIFLNNEKNTLQETVDRLINNEKTNNIEPDTMSFSKKFYRCTENNYYF